MPVETTINGDLVRDLRKRKLWTQEKLAEAARLHPRTVQRIENGGVTSLQSCSALAEALDVDPDVLQATPVPLEAAQAGPDTPTENGLLRALASRAGIDHDLPIPTSLKVLVLFWFLMGVTDYVRGLPDLLFSLGITDRSGADSALWLLPGTFNLYVCYKLLALRRSWRKVALVYNWTFMGLALAAAMVLCNALFEPATEGSILHRLLTDSVLGPTATLALYLTMAVAIFAVCLWQNTVLSSSGIRKLFDSAQRVPD